MTLQKKLDSLRIAPRMTRPRHFLPPTVYLYSRFAQVSNASLGHAHASMVATLDLRICPTANSLLPAYPKAQTTSHQPLFTTFGACLSTPTKSSKNLRTKRISRWSFSSSCRSKKAGSTNTSACALSTMTTLHPCR